MLTPFKFDSGNRVVHLPVEGECLQVAVSSFEPLNETRNNPFHTWMAESAYNQQKKERGKWNRMPETSQ